MTKLRWVQVALAALIALVIAVGCGGGGGGGGNGGGNGGGGNQTGTGSVDIAWPAQSRDTNAPSTALSARIALLNTQTQATVTSRVVNRLADPAAFNATYTLDAVPVGSYTLQITFFAGNDATGATVATASKAVTINAGANDLGDVAVTGTVDSITVPAGQTVAVGSTVQLTATALDSGSNTIAIPDGSITWTIVTGNSNANLNAAGEISGLNAGDVTVQASIDNGDTEVTAQQTVTVTAVGPSGIVVTPNPATALASGTRTFVADTAVNWSVQGGDANGTISAGGVYTAPATPGTYTITATSQANPAVTEDVQVFVGNATADLVFDFAGGDLSAGFNGVSGNGAYGVGFGTPGADNVASRFRLSTGVFDQLAGVGAGQAFDANLDGTVIVGARQQANLTAFSWSEGGGVVDLTAPIGSTTTAALGVNVNGTIIVGRALVGSVFNAVRWDSGTPTVLDTITPTLQVTNPGADAVDVNDNGNVIVGQADWDNNGDTAGGVGTRPVRWSGAGSLFSLGLLPGGTQGRANAVSAEASSSEVTIVGESATTTGGTHTEAFRWTQATGILPLGLLAGGTDSRALDVSANGNVIVGEGTTADGTEAFIWDSINGMQRLQDVLDARGIGGALAGWTLKSANAISRDGRVIVGVASRADINEPDGFEEAGFIVFLP